MSEMSSVATTEGSPAAARATYIESGSGGIDSARGQRIRSPLTEHSARTATPSPASAAPITLAALGPENVIVNGIPALVSACCASGR